MLFDQAGGVRVKVEVGQRVATICAEADHHDPIGPDVMGDPRQHASLGAGRDEGQHVAGHHHRIERVVDEGKVRQIGDEPARTAMIMLGRLDQRRIGVDADHVVTACEEFGPHPSRSAPGVENSRAARHHRIDQARLAAQIGAVGGQLPESLDVPAGMVVVVLADPARRGVHVSHGSRGPDRQLPRTVETMTTVTLGVQGKAGVDVVWERYARPSLWASWSPQISSVDVDGDRILTGLRGTVHALHAVRIPFLITEVDERARTWSWRAQLGPATLRLHHEVIERADGTRTTLRISGLAPLVFGYLPLARWALRNLVSE